MAIGIISIILLGIKRFEKINAKLHSETKLAQLLGIKRFFDKTYARKFLQEFQLPHLKQLDAINTSLLTELGDASRQNIGIVDMDQSTHSLESRKREKAVPGFNRKAPGKPCYQWSVAFVCGELVSQKLDRGNTSCKKYFIELLNSVQEKFSLQAIIVRIDGAYISAPQLNYLIEHNIQFITVVNKDDFMSNNKDLKIPSSPNLVIYKDENNKELSEEEAQGVTKKKIIKLHSLGKRKVFKKSPYELYSLLVDIEQLPIKIKGKKKKKQYIIIHNVIGLDTPRTIFEFYHQRQTIENFFKESKNPFNSSKMPSQYFRANEAYLYFVGLAYNIFALFKKIVCHMYGEDALLKLLKI
jgi:hypothetical protein